MIKNKIPYLFALPLAQSRATGQPLHSLTGNFMTEEIWKDLPELKGKYQISNLGRVKRLPIIDGRSNDNKWLPERILKQDSRQYYTVALYFGRRKKTTMVHRLIAKAFIPNPENKPFINHKNGIKYDNSLENLEWCTMLENNVHALRTGLRIGMRGMKNHWCKISYEDALEIRSMKGKCLQKVCAEKYGIGVAQVSHIQNNKSRVNY